LLSGFPLFSSLWQWRRRVRRAQKAKPRLIPTYRANGRRVSDSTPVRVERLLAEGLVVASYSRHGRLRSIQFKHDAGTNPVHKSAHQGQRYSYAQALPSGHFAWKHRELLGRGEIEALFGELTAEEIAQRDRFVRSVFRAVPLSVLRRDAPARTAPAAPRQQQHRPIEFDSEGRRVR